MKEIERAIVDYFESASAKVHFDGVEWWVTVGEEGDVVSLTGASVAVFEAIKMKPVTGD